MKPIKSQRGAIDIILIIVVFVLAAGLGGYVYYRQQQNQKSLDAAGKGVIVAKHVDPTAKWTPFSSTNGKFSLKYPASWNKVICDSKDETLYLGPNTKAVAICNSGYTGQIVVYNQAGDQRALLKLSSTDYSGVSSVSVTVVGAVGTKQSGVSVGNGVNLAKGEKLTRFVFYVGGRTLVADYSYDANNTNEQDVYSDFDTMVTKTLKFN